MTEQGSPAGESTKQGGTVVPFDRDKHRPEGRGSTWEVAKMNPTTDHPALVVELEPTTARGRQLTAAELERLPPFFAEAPATANPTTTETTSRTDQNRAPSKALRKFDYLVELRGRIGKGEQDLTPAEFAALVMLHTYADADLNNARPGHGRLAADLGYTGDSAKKTVGKLTRSLEAKGYLLVTRKGSNRGGNLATTYTLTLPKRS